MDVAIEDAVFVACAVIGLGLLIVAVAFEDRFYDLLERLRLDADADTPWGARALGFLVAFGVVGLVLALLLNVGGLPTFLLAAVAGVGGWAVGPILLERLRPSNTGGPVSMRELVGGPALVAVRIPAGQFGSVYVRAVGQTHEYSATASVDIEDGTDVTVTGALGEALVVAPLEPPLARPLTEGDLSDT